MSHIRAEQRETYAMVLRTQLSRRGTPYSMRTVGAYLDALDSLARHLPGSSGFEVMTVRDLNGYHASYFREHGLPGTCTKQQNIRTFLRFLADEYGTADLWLDPKRARYQRQDVPPPVLPRTTVAALLKATSGRSFEDRRDHAILRILLIGLRREEVALLRVEDLDLTSAHRSAAVEGLKGSPGRRVPLGDRDVLALRRWLTMRGPQPGALWIAERTGDRLKGNGIAQMLRRRAVQAGFPRGAIRPHLFRHTFAHEFLSTPGNNEGDLMALAGWRDRSMVLRYGASMSEQRAHEAVARSGFSDRY